MTSLKGTIAPSGLGRGQEVISSLPGQLASERHPVALARPGTPGRGTGSSGSSGFREPSNLGSFLFGALLKILEILLIRSLDPDPVIWGEVSRWRVHGRTATSGKVFRWENEVSWQCEWPRSARLGRCR